jgi:hypothetical protein
MVKIMRFYEVHCRLEGVVMCVTLSVKLLWRRCDMGSAAESRATNYRSLPIQCRVYAPSLLGGLQFFQLSCNGDIDMIDHVKKPRSLGEYVYVCIAKAGV